MSDWWLGRIVPIILILVVVFVGVSVWQECAQQAAFMRECLTEKKQYECTALWRAGEAHTVPVFIYGGR